MAVNCDDEWNGCHYRQPTSLNNRGCYGWRAVAFMIGL